ncbi:hypothetical protein LSAT2_011427 [Lamellibrachia satsuma]|nr:hypothetical protein LSAT2_011427 [Lamellibrachia satsuma]
MTNPRSVLLTIYGALLAATTARCPVGYSCEWATGVYVLRCNPVFSSYQVGLVTGTITDLPVNATRVKIKCFSRRIVVLLKFSDLANVRELILDSFNVTSVSREVFRGVTRLSLLTLRNLYWRRLEKWTFSGLDKLRSLFLECLDDLEYMHPEVLSPLTSLDSLSFRHVGANNDRLMYADYSDVLRRLPPYNLRSLTMYAVHSEKHPETRLDIDTLFNKGLSSQGLRHLDMGCNNIFHADGSPARCWPAIEYVSFAENAFLGALFITSFWVQFYTHPRLKTVDLSRNNQRALSSGDAVFRLTVDETCDHAFPLDLGPMMESVSISGSTYIANTHTRHLPMCVRSRNNTMRYVDISNNRVTVALSFSLVQLRSLEYLNVQNLNMRRLTASLFSGMSKLSMLLLGRNNVGASIANDSGHALFSHNTNLRMLDLADCHITAIPPDEFSRLRHLQVLNLSLNEMISFTVNLSKLTSLRFLNISHNKLTTLSAATLQELDHLASERTIQVDISGNHLLCLSRFVTWAKTTTVHFLNADNTLCTDENGTQQIVFGALATLTERLVDVDNTGRTLSIVMSLSTIVLAITVLAYVSYRCRWKIAFCCHRLKGGAPSDAAPDGRPYKRDAFICYNSNDRAWVCGDLLQCLQDNHVSTIMHHRDFLPGSLLEETIRESIDVCRYTVLVLSPDFLSSNWCLLEMHLARSRIISQGRDVIVPIILHEFPTSQVTRTLEGILSRSYLEWTIDPQGQALFWDKLITKLKQGGNIRPLDN